MCLSWMAYRMAGRRKCGALQEQTHRGHEEPRVDIFRILLNSTRIQRVPRFLTQCPGNVPPQSQMPAFGTSPHHVKRRRNRPYTSSIKRVLFPQNIPARKRSQICSVYCFNPLRLSAFSMSLSVEERVLGPSAGGPSMSRTLRPLLVVGGGWTGGGVGPFDVAGAA